MVGSGCFWRGCLCGDSCGWKWEQPTPFHHACALGNGGINCVTPRGIEVVGQFPPLLSNHPRQIFLRILHLSCGSIMDLAILFVAAKFRTCTRKKLIQTSTHTVLHSSRVQWNTMPQPHGLNSDVGGSVHVREGFDNNLGFTGTDGIGTTPGTITPLAISLARTVLFMTSSLAMIVQPQAATLAMKASHTHTPTPRC
jgi:hypothetical protein